MNAVKIKSVYEAAKFKRMRRLALLLLVFSVGFWAWTFPNPEPPAAASVPYRWEFKFYNGLGEPSVRRTHGFNVEEALGEFRGFETENATIITVCRIGFTECQAKGF